MNEILKNIISRRSVRSFSSKQISDEEVNQLVTAGLYAPTGMNHQSSHLAVVQNQEKLLHLNEQIKNAFAKSDDKRLQERGANSEYCCYYHAPTLIILSNAPEHWWAAMDCACAIENIYLAANALGIGACWINQLGTTHLDEDVRACLSEFGVPQEYHVYGAIALGYPAKDLHLKEKVIRDGRVTIVK